ncbi:MAG TPA: dTMP kinase [Phycisphaerales bacterium]|nr:dTMP kinase [Phycisphaerales bacterium]HMP37537.1 dTMP kinase [Phycisphaerales bacterium]
MSSTDSPAIRSAPARPADWIAALRGRFIVLDGPDGSGKSTQFRLLADFCRSAGLRVTETREPGGTPIGEQVRAILLDPLNVEMDVRCEMLLYMASRAQLVAERIRPALERGDLVLADRFISSTLAYQGTAGGISTDAIRSVGRIACGATQPDLVVLFDVDEVVAGRRLNPILDRMEQKGIEFHRRVRRGYLDQAATDPARHLVIDATPETEQVWTSLLAAIERWTRPPAR